MALKFQSIIPKSISYGAERSYSDIKYIVIHYTGNSKDTAENNAKYFATTNTRKAGAHAFVDGSGTVYKSVPINRVAWAVGGFYTKSNGAGSMYNKITNSNSLSIEMCNSAGSVPTKVFNDAVELTKYYMDKYNVPASRVYRHWDVNGKSCPAPWANKNSTGWKNFKKAIQNKSTSNSNSNKTSNSSTTSSSSQKSVNYKVKINTSSGVNMRTGAGTSYGVVTAIPNNATVVISKESDSWGYTTYNNKKGWICLEYTKKVSSSNTSSNTSSKMTKTQIVINLQKNCNAQGFSDQKVDGIEGTNTLNGCPTLKKGASGEITKCMQQLLVYIHGYSISCDGEFGSDTEACVKKFQKTKGLTADGIVGKNTWKKLLGL